MDEKERQLVINLEKCKEAVAIAEAKLAFAKHGLYEYRMRNKKSEKEMA